jgi:hypothetical protein
MKCKNQPALACPIGNIGASAHPMAAFSGYYESHEAPPSGNVRGIVPLHRDGHRNGQQRGYILHRRFVDCRHGGRRGDTEPEQLVARWQRPVASNVALDMLHHAMPRTLLQRLHMTIKMACNGGTFSRLHQYFA